MGFKQKMKKSDKIIIVLVLFCVFFSGFSYLSPQINPFMYPLVFSLAGAGINICLIIVSILPAILLRGLTLANAIIALNLISCVVLFKICSKFKKAKTVLMYIFCNLSQLGVIYLSLSNKTLIISACISIIASNLFMFVFPIAINAIKLKKLNGYFSFDEKLSFACIFVAIFIGISKIHINSLFLIYPLAVFAILVFSRVLKMIDVCALSSLIALSLSVSTNSVLPFAIILVWTMVACFFAEQNKIIEAVSVLFSDLVMGCALNAYLDYTYVNLLSVLVPSVAFCLIPKLDIMKAYFLNSGESIVKNYYINQSFYNLSNKLIKMSNVFDDMQKVYKSNLLNQMPQEKLGEFLSKNILSKHCEACGLACKNREVLESDFADCVNIALKNEITKTNLPSSFNHLCPFLSQILSQINGGVKEFNALNKKFSEQNKSLCALSENCKQFSSCLVDMSKKMYGFKISEKINADQIIAEFNINNLVVGEVLVLDTNQNKNAKIMLVIRTIDKADLRFIQIISNIFKQRFITENIADSGVCGWSVLTLVKAPIYNLFFGVSTFSKLNKNGDNYLYQKIENSKTILAIADGMGNGDNANEKSNLCLDLILSYLSIGASKEIAISNINGLLIPYKNDNFSTLDLFEFDANSGRGDFIKLASAVSFIKRKDKVEVVRPESLPLGIVESVSPTVNTTYLTTGDLVILCSDGVVDSIGEETMIEMLSTNKILNAQIMADLILDEAKRQTTVLDDMTCLVCKVTNY